MTELEETDIPWVGGIPQEWRVKPMFSLVKENKLKNKEKNENVLSLSYGRIIRRDLSKNFGLLPETFDGYQVVENGYLIIRSTDLQNDKKSLRVGLVKETGVITSAYIGLRPQEGIDPKYLFYYLNMCDLKKVFYSLGGGLRQSLRYDEFRRFPLILPDQIEQQQLISRFLDKKTEQIDSLVEKIQRKIELLKEQRTSLINQCVTKGLDPNVEMKDSGIEWVGEIPKHWSLSKIKWVTKKIGSGVTPKGGGDVYSDSGIPFLRSQNIHFDGLHLDDVVFISEEIDGSMSGSRVLKNDVLYNITGGSIGRCCLMDSDVPMNVNQHVCIVRSKEGLDPSYLLTILSSKFGQTQLEMNLTGSGREGLNFENLGNFLIPMMNDSEQQRIGEKVTRINTDFFILETKLKQRIGLFKEYRQSLISSVVTGKVRVTEDMI